jgi:hypothetical protein
MHTCTILSILATMRDIYHLSHCGIQNDHKMIGQSSCSIQCPGSHETNHITLDGIGCSPLPSSLRPKFCEKTLFGSGDLAHRNVALLMAPEAKILGFSSQMILNCPYRSDTGPSKGGLDEKMELVTCLVGVLIN